MFSVVLDTCVLYPAYLRDTLLRMAAAALYRPATTLDELVTNLRDHTGLLNQLDSRQKPRCRCCADR